MPAKTKGHPIMPEIASIAALYAQARTQRRCIIPPNASARRTLSRRVLQGVLVRPFRGLYAERSYWQSLNPNEQALHIIRALALMHPDWTFAGPSAALVLGLDCLYELSKTIYRAVRRPERTACANGIRAIPMSDQTATLRADGILVTSVETTVYDCAATFLPSRALGFADCALRLGKTTNTALHDHAMNHRHDRHWTKASQTIDLANGLSENGGESKCRGILHECGADVPQLQQTVRCLDDPRKSHRLDMVWDRTDGSKVACELDGTRKYVDPTMVGTQTLQQVVEKERDRQRCLERQGVDVFRLFYNELDALGDVRRTLYEHRVPMNKAIQCNLGTDIWG